MKARMWMLLLLITLATTAGICGGWKWGTSKQTTTQTQSAFVVRDGWSWD